MSSEDEQMIYVGPIGFDVPVPVAGIPEEHGLLQRLADVITCRYTGTGDDRALVEIEAVNDTDGWAFSALWEQILGTLERIARRHGRALRTSATFASDERGRGLLVIDEGGRFHDCQGTLQVQQHRTRTCDCWWVQEEPSREVFVVAEVTQDERVQVQQFSAGPFTDVLVTCTEHGEVYYGVRQREAIFRREAHLLAEHTARPFPLDRQPATDAMPEEAQHFIQLAAARLREARAYAPALAIKYRNAARDYTRRADHSLRQSGVETDELIRMLVHGLVERTADSM